MKIFEEIPIFPKEVTKFLIKFGVYVQTLNHIIKPDELNQELLSIQSIKLTKYNGLFEYYFIIHAKLKAKELFHSEETILEETQDLWW